MKTIKGGIWRFNPTKMYEKYYNAIMDVCIIAARRAEDEAKILLAERMQDDKSSGTLQEGIMGIVDIRPNAIIIGLMASAVETGQWESQMGEPEEADYATSDPLFDYAMAVEQGTGIFAENDSGGDMGNVISGNPEFVFWTGEYNENLKKSLVMTPFIKGQPALHYLRDALLMIQPQIDEMLKKVFNKINMEEFLELVK